MFQVGPAKDQSKSVTNKTGLVVKTRDFEHYGLPEENSLSPIKLHLTNNLHAMKITEDDDRDATFPSSAIDKFSDNRKTSQS